MALQASITILSTEVSGHLSSYIPIAGSVVSQIVDGRVEKQDGKIGAIDGHLMVRWAWSRKVSSSEWSDEARPRAFISAWLIGVRP